jgi:hypothetical protein
MSVKGQDFINNVQDAFKQGGQKLSKHLTLSPNPETSKIFILKDTSSLQACTNVYIQKLFLF